MDSHSKSQERFFNAFLGLLTLSPQDKLHFDCSQLRKCLQKGSRKKLKFSHSHISPRATALTPPVSHLIKCLAILVFVIVFHAVYTKKYLGSQNNYIPQMWTLSRLTPNLSALKVLYTHEHAAPLQARQLIHLHIALILRLNTS